MELIKPQKGTNYNIEHDIQNLTNIEQEFEQIDNKITKDISSSIDELKDKVDNDITTAITALDNKVDTEIVTAIDNLETKINTEISESITALDTKVTTSLQEQAENLKKEISDQIAKVVANSPEDFDTLKEISDWISGHSSDASSMNSTISGNTSAINQEILDRQAADTALQANIDKKVDKDLSNVTGVLPISKGGTEATTKKEAEYNLFGSINISNEAYTDNTSFTCIKSVRSNTVGVFIGKRASGLWTYIKDKISSVLGLTSSSYDGKAATAGTADTAKGWQEYVLNLKSLSNSNFYPVVIDTLYKFVDVEIRSEEGHGGLPYNQNRIKFTISTAGWSDAPKSLFISEYNRYDANEVTIGCIGCCTDSDYKAVIWLRGGINYTCYTMNCPSAPSVKTVDTALDTSIVTVGTSYSGGTNTYVSILFTPDTDMSKGIYSSAGMTTAGNLKVRNTIAGATLSGYGAEPLSIGVGSNLNVGMDYNSIQARNNGAASSLDLNYYGGMVRVNAQGLANGGLKVGGRLTIPTSAPSNPQAGDIWIG